jgi:hypothetical protein
MVLFSWGGVSAAQPLPLYTLIVRTPVALSAFESVSARWIKLKAAGGSPFPLSLFAGERLHQRTDGHPVLPFMELLRAIARELEHHLDDLARCYFPGNADERLRPPPTFAQCRWRLSSQSDSPNNTLRVCRLPLPLSHARRGYASRLRSPSLAPRLFHLLRL